MPTLCFYLLSKSTCNNKKNTELFADDTKQRYHQSPVTTMNIIRSIVKDLTSPDDAQGVKFYTNTFYQEHEYYYIKSATFRTYFQKRQLKQRNIVYTLNILRDITHMSFGKRKLKCMKNLKEISATYKAPPFAFINKKYL